MTDRPAPMFVSVKDAATMLGLTLWGAHQLLDEQGIESRYCGRRRLVVVESLIEYTANLPTTPVLA